MVGYYRYNFAAKAVPLTRLLRKEDTLHSGATQDKSFQELIYALTHTHILVFPDYKCPFIMCTEADTLRLGAVLMQCNKRDKNHVIAYPSRTVNLAEANYSITHLETLAVVLCLKHFRDIISGYEITVCTDHATVIELFKDKNLTGKPVRWYFTMQEFSPKFECIQGRSNEVADGSSRNAQVGAVSDINCNQFFTSGSGCCTKKS